MRRKRSCRETEARVRGTRLLDNGHDYGNVLGGKGDSANQWPLNEATRVNINGKGTV
jgi:hypothetical protein